MNEPSSPTSAIAVAAVVIGIGLALYGTLRATRPQTPARALAGIALAAGAYLLLAVGAAIQLPQGDGLRAAAFQGLTVLLAVALGALSLRRSGEGTSGSGRGLASVALFAAWLCLLGLPPTAGFHARLLVYRALLQAGWSGAFAIALAISVAGLIPAFSAIALGSPGGLRGGRAALAVALLAVLLLVGLYPGFGLTAADFLAGSR
jgi:NADH:ubiquinone oxidoreductase subunit 2 (subunit N)